MLKRLTLFLGPARLRTLFLLFAITGLLSLILNAVTGDWVRPVQSGLALIFILGAGWIVWTSLDPFDRGRWLSTLLPAVGAVIIGFLFLPDYALLLIGGAVGWVVASVFLFSPGGPMQYQQAVKHLRKNEYEEAVKIMDKLVREEPKNPNHYRFRAEILRIWGKLNRAKRDYKTMTELAPDSAVAFNGLAEVYLQSGEYVEAHNAALKAYQLAPDEWVAAYNLGMIEDRLGESDAAAKHLNESLAAKVPDVRHRLLIYLYLVRAWVRLGDLDRANAELNTLKKQRDGLREWETIFSSDQSETLKQVIEADVRTAEALIRGELTPQQLA
jgi:tetratricopeptide (TPR) repeat protein